MARCRFSLRLPVPPQPAGHLLCYYLGVLHSHGTLCRLNEEDMLCANILALPDVILLSSGHSLREATEYPLKRFHAACCMLSFCRRSRCRSGAGCGGMLLCGHSIPPAWLRIHLVMRPLLQAPIWIWGWSPPTLWVRGLPTLLVAMLSLSVPLFSDY